MGLLSDFFIADEARAQHYEGGQDFDDADKCSFKYITPLEGERFLAVLRGEPYSAKSGGKFELITPEEAEEWTMTVPDDMVALLAAISRRRLPASPRSSPRRRARSWAGRARTSSRW